MPESNGHAPPTRNQRYSTGRMTAMPTAKGHSPPLTTAPQETHSDKHGHCEWLRHGRRGRRGSNCERLAVVLGELQQIVEPDGSVGIEIAVGKAARLAVVLGQDQQVREAHGAV